MIKLKDWMMQKESTPFTRARRAAALGLGPSIPDASINSGNTAAPWESKNIKKRNKKKKKKKKKISESNKNIKKNLDIDKWFEIVEDIKDELNKIFKSLTEKQKDKIKKILNKII